MLVVALVCTSPLAWGSLGPATALSVAIVEPPEGSWTANATETLRGTVDDVGISEIRLGSDLEFSGGTFQNTTVESGALVMNLSGPEVWSYLQDFAGRTNESAIDAHWPSTLSATGWWVMDSSAAGDTPPALVHQSTGSSRVSWNAHLPGPLANGSLGFDYGCQANGRLTVSVSVSGFLRDEVEILATNASARTSLTFRLEPTFTGATAFFVRITGSSSNATAGTCYIDDWAFSAEYATSSPDQRHEFSDDFGAGENAAIDLARGDWRITSEPMGVGNAPSLVHNTTTPSSAVMSLAFVAPLQNATIALAYRTGFYGLISLYVGTNERQENLVIDHVNNFSATDFSIDVGSLVRGGHGIRLRVEGSGTWPGMSEAVIDDLHVVAVTDGALQPLRHGQYVSPVVDAGAAARLVEVAWAVGLPPSASASFEVRGSSNGLTYDPFLAIIGNRTSPLTRTFRYYQFRVNMTGSVGSDPIRLEWMEARLLGVASLAWTADGIEWNSLPAAEVWSFESPLAGGANRFELRACDTTGACANRSVAVFRDVFPPDAPGIPQGP